MKKENMESLFDSMPEREWEKEWKGMPEFCQKDIMPFRTIMVHFESQEDIKKFSALIDQNITILTKYVWYPKQDIKSVSKKRWCDES
jgi:hypothetical protein